MRTDVQIVGDEDTKRGLREVGKQAPFALSLALNRLANAAQKEVQDQLGSRFTLRQADFMKRTIYRARPADFATKQQLEAAIRVNDQTDNRGRKRDFLAKFEEGGLKVPTAGRAIAIPVEARRNKRDIVTAANRPRAILKRPKFYVAAGAIKQAVGRGKAATTRVWYIFKRSIRIAPRLGMADTTKRVTEARWAEIASAAIEQAVRTAR